MKIQRMFSNVEEEKLYSTGNDKLDELLERAFCEGYEYAQREFVFAADAKNLTERGKKELRRARHKIAKNLNKNRKAINKAAKNSNYQIENIEDRNEWYIKGPVLRVKNDPLTKKAIFLTPTDNMSLKDALKLNRRDNRTTALMDARQSAENAKRQVRINDWSRTLK